MKENNFFFKFKCVEEIFQWKTKKENKFYEFIWLYGEENNFLRFYMV